MNEINGYKSFYPGLRTNYGDTLEVGRLYIYDGLVTYHVSGYHFCKRLEDTLRYIGGIDNDCDICQVVGSNLISYGEDEYYGYYDLYSASQLEIVKVLTRQEIMDLMIDNKNVREERINRFVSNYRLTEDEIQRVIESYPSDLVKDSIKYYQRGDKNAFIRRR